MVHVDLSVSPLLLCFTLVIKALLRISVLTSSCVFSGPFTSSVPQSSGVQDELLPTGSAPAKGALMSRWLVQQINISKNMMD